MFVSNKKYQALLECVESLKSRLASVEKELYDIKDNGTKIRVYGERGLFRIPYKEISTNSLIEVLLVKNGMKLEYKEGNDAFVDIVDVVKDQKASAKGKVGGPR